MSIGIPPLLRSEIATRLLYLDGAPFSFYDYPFYPAIYDGSDQGVLLKCGRQTAKSTSLCNFIVSESIGRPHFRTLYVSPSQEQTQTFSNTRVAKVVQYSPLVRRFFTTREFTSRTMLRMFKNGAEVKFTYACDDPDRARGNTADRLAIDEVQDILYDAVIPVLIECMGNSKYGYETYAGTPKTMENTIEYLWSISTQTEWIMRCSGCGNWNFIDSIASVGLTGPVCLRCGKNLQPREGRWYSFNPDVKVESDTPVKSAVKIKGYHINQLMLPLNNEEPARWQRILNKLERYGETKFKNEVLGVSDALGARLISKQELEELCKDYDIYRVAPADAKQYSHICAGIDWSGGGTEGVSRTVLWIFGITDDHRLKTLYFRIYPVVNPVTIVEDILEVLKSYNVELTLGDRGEGHLPNKIIQQAMGRNRVTQVSYGLQAKPIVWAEDADCYRVDRTTLMDNYFMVLKRGGVIYPRISYMRDPISDILNLYEEVTSAGKKVWRHAPTQPDDSFHAQLLAWLAAKVLMMDLQFQA